MRVYVKTNGRRFFVPVPLCLANLGISLIQAPFIQKYIPEKDRKYMDMIDYRALRKSINILRHYRGLRLVEVKAKDGTEVTITI
ncbi:MULTISPECIES: hypothetical protein [Clostridium]|uniref:hypothetical protein n=1 Tax=Clostridium TaxID=1485 RepID=UPI00069F4445|nr:MULTISPECIES: hypothetical protein [Clostridium]KOF57104.1 hypothetical protein AGR56_11230 [Clostridium sp. DMHC 10]MCD2348685.1 hypothetical protein [Clostridium guangxiense]